VRVPQRHRIGEEGAGFFLQMLQFQEERLWAGANVVGACELGIRETVEYTRMRKAFGHAILENQWVQFKLAELLTEVEALRGLVYHAVERMLDGDNVTRLASMAKLKAGRLSREVADTCLQFWGGMGYAWETRIARMFRDGRLASIGGGPDEIMMGIICKLADMPPDRPKQETTDEHR
jgi:citronellyl-CoA dehydrogenase